MPVRVQATEGTVADCSRALPLIEGIEAECLLADKAYDTNEIIAAAMELGMEPVIPLKSNRKEQREYDRMSGVVVPAARGVQIRQAPEVHQDAGPSLLRWPQPYAGHRGRVSERAAYRVPAHPVLVLANGQRSEYTSELSPTQSGRSSRNSPTRLCSSLASNQSSSTSQRR